MDPLLKQISEQLDGILEWQKNHERHDDERFSTMAAAINQIPSKDDLGELASKADMKQLNTMLHNFILGVGITKRIGKVGFYVIITIGSIGAGLVLIKGGFITILAWIGFTQIK